MLLLIEPFVELKQNLLVSAIALYFSTNRTIRGIETFKIRARVVVVALLIEPFVELKRRKGCFYRRSVILLIEPFVELKRRRRP